MQSQPASAAPAPVTPLSPLSSSSSSSANIPPYKIVKVSANSKNYVTIIGDPNLSEKDLLESIYKLPAPKPQPLLEQDGTRPQVQIEDVTPPKLTGGRRRTMNHSKGMKRSKNRSTKRSKGRKQRK